MFCFIAQNGDVVVKHWDMETSLKHQRHNGVHLNVIGKDIWMLGLHKGVEQALAVCRDSCVSYPEAKKLAATSPFFYCAQASIENSWPLPSLCVS